MDDEWAESRLNIDELPDDYRFPTQRGAEIALGLPMNTIPNWIEHGRVVPLAPEVQAHMNWTAKVPMRDRRWITAGELRAAMASYHPRKPARRGT